MQAAVLSHMCRYLGCQHASHCDLQFTQTRLNGWSRRLLDVTVVSVLRWCVECCVVSCSDVYAGTLFASTRHTVAFSPGNKGWVINEGDWPGQLLSFVLDSDGEHWRSIKVCLLGL